MRYLDENGLQVVANKVKGKQDAFETGNSLEFVTAGEGQIDDVLYLGLDNVLTSELPSTSRTNITVTDPEKALGLANQLIKVQFFGFIDATMVTISAVSPQTTTGAVEGDTIVPTVEPVILLDYVNTVSLEYAEWCATYGVSFNIPWEYNTTLITYLSSPTLSISRTLNYRPDDTRISDENSWSSAHTREMIDSLLPLPLVDSETATIEESTVPTWSYIQEVEDVNSGETVDTQPDIIDSYLLQKFLWDTTVGATELPQTMSVVLREREIYIGVYGFVITCNGLQIGQTVDPLNMGSSIFESNVGITWDYWRSGTYTVTFDGETGTPVQKVEVNNAIDEEARETAAGAIGLAQSVGESVSKKITYVGAELEYNIHSWSDTKGEGTSTYYDFTITKDGWYSIDVTLTNASDVNNSFSLRDFDGASNTHGLFRVDYGNTGAFRISQLIALKAGTYRYNHGGVGTVDVYMNRRDFAY